MPAGSLFVQTIEPVEIITRPDEDCVIYYEQVKDEDQSPYPFTGYRTLDIRDADGTTVLMCSTQGNYIRPRAGTTNIDEIVIPQSVMATLPPGEYHGPYCEVLSATSRRVIVDFVFQQVSR